MHALTNTPEKKYEFNLEIFKNLLDCLGLNFGFRIKTKQARNNYFETPLYLINNSFSYNSLLKLYKLSNKSLPKRNVNEIGLFYDPFWPEELIIKDFRSQEIDIKYDMSETSFNLLKDLNYYTLAECDMIFDNKGKCHRIDQKCITKKEFDAWTSTDVTITDGELTMTKKSITVTATWRTPTPTALDNTDASVKAVKYFKDGQLFIEKNGHVYNVYGACIK